MGKTLLVVLIVLAVVSISSLAYAHYRGFWGGVEGRADWLTERVSRRLELDDQQRQQLGQLRDKMVELAGQMRSERPQHIEQAQQLLETPQLDRQQAYRLWEEKHAWLAVAGPALIDAFADFSDSLNQAQREELQQMIRQHREHRHGGYCWGGGQAKTMQE